MLPNIARTLCLVALPAFAASACATPSAIGSPPGTPSALRGAAQSPIAVQRAWWRAFVLADSATLNALSAPGLRFIASTGHTFDRAETLAEALSSSTGSRLSLTWSEEHVRALLGGQAVVVTARLTETEGRTVNHYRFTGVLERATTAAERWRVTVAQRTREAVFTARIASGQAGDLTMYAGRYRVPSGAALAVVVQDSALTLTDPNGAVQRLEPVGPSLFESTRLSSSNGIVRFAFARDERGRVVAVSRLIQGGIWTFPRVENP